MTRWGTNGLAVSTANGPTHFIQSDLIGPGSVPGPAPSPTPTPNNYSGASIRPIFVASNDLLYNSFDKKLYISVPGNAGAGIGNTITRIDPINGSIFSSVFIGSEPNKLALSDLGTTLYASLNGANAVRRFNTISQTAGLQFVPANNGNETRDLSVLPGSPASVVVSAGDGRIAIYDDGVKRPVSPNIWVGPIEHNGTPNVLYGYNDVSTGFNLYKLSVNGDGLTVATNVQNLIYGFNRQLTFSGGRIYCSDGRVVDPETSRIVGTFAASMGSAVTVDAEKGRAFFIGRDNY